MITFRTIALLLATTLWAMPGWSAVSSVSQLVTDGRLTVDASITPNDNIVPGQKLRLLVTVATDRWFAGGTRIDIPEVPGLIILQTEKFASNASENRNGQTWVVQRWSLDVYALQVGHFRIPPLNVSPSINAGSDGNATGETQTQALEFDTALPPMLKESDSWVASPEYRITDRFDRELKNLSVGDAFERRVEFKASDVMAMMLPSLQPAQQQGLSAYPAPPTLDNRSNRGTSTAVRIETVSYIIEEEGLFTLPQRDYYWWDTEQSKLRTITLEARDILVGSGVSPPVTATELPAWQPSRGQLIAGAVGACIIVIVFWSLIWLSRELPLSRILSLYQRLWHCWHQFRAPALPSRLNPDSSSAD